MRVLIVEPHFDDAWINLGGFILLNPEYHFHIVTLSSHPSNMKNGLSVLKKYIKNLSGEFLGYRSLGYDDKTIRLLEKKYNNKDYKKMFLDLNNLDSFSKIKEKIRKKAINFDMILWPLGLKHPQHRIMHYLNPFTEFFYYREYPYFFYKYQKKSTDFLKGKKKVVWNIKGVLSEKIRIFKEAYKDQQFLLNLNIEGTKLENLDTEVFWRMSTKKFN